MHELPNSQEIVERVVKNLRNEILNAFCILNEQPLNHILNRGAD
jgi:hypothetical protein